MQTRATYPIWIALASAILWGLWWIPIRAIEASGLIWHLGKCRDECRRTAASARLRFSFEVGRARRLCALF